MVYEWKKGSQHKVSADVAGEVCSRLEKEGRLTAKNLVDESRDENAPLHDEFEWRDDVAAEKYREEQARYIIRSLTFVGDTTQEPVRAFFKIEETYENTQVLVSEPTKRETLLQQAFREFSWFEKKYNALVEFKPVFDLVEQIKKEA